MATDRESLRRELLSSMMDDNYWELWSYPVFYESLPTEESKLIAIVKGDYEKVVDYALDRHDFCGFNSVPGMCEKVFKYGKIKKCKVPIVSIT